MTIHFDSNQVTTEPRAKDSTPPDVLGEAQLRAIEVVARFHGTELDRRDFKLQGSDPRAASSSLVAWLEQSGLWAKAAKLSWRQLRKTSATSPIVLLFNDASAGLVVGRSTERDTVLIKDPDAPDDSLPTEVDELQLGRFWNGRTILVRKARDEAFEDAPFSFGWLAGLVLKEKRNLREVVVASIALSVLQILPPFLVMTALDRVLVHRSLSTLAMVSLILLVTTVYETFIGFARREIVEVMSTRLDARLNMHVFSRLLALPIDFYEKRPTGETTHNISQVFKIRDFLTGKLVATCLDLFTLAALLPFLFWMSSTLAWIVLGGALLITGIVMGFLPVIGRVWGRLIVAETKKGAVLVETVHGIRTIKSLAIEKVRQAEWDERIAEAGQARLASGRIANWAQTAVTPIERFIDRGVLLLGAYVVLTSPNGTSGITAGSLVAFMLLGGRVASPLISLAKLLQDFQEVNASVSQVASVLNNPTETAAARGGLRPSFDGAISFADLTFSYPGTPAKALDQVSFDVPAGTTLGIVGRSGSGKSTITRLLQGINREYSGSLKIDGADLREINLTHLRRSFGVVLQDNFLFRGTVQDNVIAGRPGLTLEDCVRAVRLAGAEEFVERLPHGYGTWIEEGSANLSGGQRQRLAIARALIADPRILILDEATSALDPESEALVNANLARIAKGRTMVIVSHRLSSLVGCDQILVMDRGHAVNIGTHTDLLENCSIYSQLWAQQNRHVEPAPRPVLAAIAGRS